MNTSHSLFNVLDHGAMGDGRHFDTQAIQSAIDACLAAGGGTVVLPAGHTYLSGSLVLGPHLDFHIESGATLLASPSFNDYLVPDLAVLARTTGRRATPDTVFLYARSADHLRLSGSGTIDGNGRAFVSESGPYLETGFYPRPTLIFVEKCDHFSVVDLTIRDAPFWTIHPAGCNDVLIRDLRILNNLKMANSDGIDPDHCRNVRILGCHIECADDCIVLKNTRDLAHYGPCEQVLIQGCTLISTSAAIKIGTEGVSDFKDILVSGCIISRSNRGLSIQIRDEGRVENVRFADCLIQTRRFHGAWWGRGEPVSITVFDRNPGTRAGSVRNVVFSRISCQGENAAYLEAGPGREISDIRFHDCRFGYHAQSRWEPDGFDQRPGEGLGLVKKDALGMYLCQIKNIRIHGCTFAMPVEKALVHEDCRDLWQDGTCLAPE